MTFFRARSPPCMEMVFTAEVRGLERGARLKELAFRGGFRPSLKNVVHDDFEFLIGPVAGNEVKIFISLVERESHLDAVNVRFSDAGGETHDLPDPGEGNGFITLSSGMLGVKIDGT